MGKDKIKPENLGKLFFEIYIYTKSFNNRVIEGLKDIDSQMELPPDEEIMAELDFLHIYAIYQAFYNRFKSYYDVFEKNFRTEYRKYFRKIMSENETLKYERDLLEALTGYMKKHNETIAKGINVETQIEFGRYVCHRVIGHDLGDDIRYIMFLYSAYIGDLFGLLEVIDKSVEII